MSESAIEPDSVIPGLSYIIWVKDTDDKSTDDAFYAVVYQGSSKFGYMDFDFVCKTANKKFFITNKVIDGQKNCTWEECQYELKECQPFTLIFFHFLSADYK